MSVAPSPEQLGHRAKLLAVDDEPILRTSLRGILSLLGYQVEEAASGHEALRLVESAPYDLMMLDMRMPGMDGIEVMHRVREMGLDMSLIVLTANASLDTAIAAVEADAADYMLKPVKIEALSATVARTLQERADRIRWRR